MRALVVLGAMSLAGFGSPVLLMGTHRHAALPSSSVAYQLIGATSEGKCTDHCARDPVCTAYTVQTEGDVLNCFFATADTDDGLLSETSAFTHYKMGNPILAVTATATSTTTGNPASTETTIATAPSTTTGDPASTAATKASASSTTKGNPTSTATTATSTTPTTSAAVSRLFVSNQITGGDYERQNETCHRENGEPAILRTQEMVDQLLQLYRDRMDYWGIWVPLRRSASGPVWPDNTLLSDTDVAHMLGSRGVSPGDCFRITTVPDLYSKDCGGSRSVVCMRLS